MCEQTEIVYLDGEVVWVKLGSCWWPGEVIGSEKLPSDLLPSFRKPPIAVVKFFQEDTYEYVKNINNIYKYNCSRKNEFIKKGLDTYRSKHGHMEKFPQDVVRAEEATNGDVDILTRDEFQEARKESYAGIFGDPKKTPCSGKRVRGGKSKVETPNATTPIRKFHKGNSDYKAHILVQNPKASATLLEPSKETGDVSTPSTSRAGSECTDDKHDDKDKAAPATPATPAAPTPGTYSCHACPFISTRLNVMILHTKTHSATFTPYTPSPVRKKPTAKPTPKSTPTTTKTPKPKAPRAEKSEPKPKKSQSKKRVSDEKRADDAKKSKTDEAIKTSLLADWDDGEDEESNGEESSLTRARSPEVAVGEESPAVPIAQEMSSAQVPAEATDIEQKKPDDPPTAADKPESSDAKYEFCEDEDWPVEADAGRKIPRIKNRSKRTGDSKSLSLDEEEVAKEVAELLNSTTVPELPSVPEPLKVEENFPERSIAKTPDKKDEISADSNKSDENKTSETGKSIFKTKTFFRSRHSRSQDAIGKYIAEQLNAAERMNISDSELNGSESVSSPDARDSPPGEIVRVARLAPKIQLKKMKAEAEAAQLKDRENVVAENAEDISAPPVVSGTVCSEIQSEKETAEVTPATINLVNDINMEIHSSEPEIDNLMEQEDIPAIKKDIESEEYVPAPEPESFTDIKDTNESQKESESLESVPSSVDKCDGYLNETTVSAVDALLSVSRDADRVTKNVSNDLPEDLFEDDKAEIVVNQISSDELDTKLNNGQEHEIPMETVEIQNDVSDKNGFVETQIETENEVVVPNSAEHEVECNAIPNEVEKMESAPSDNAPTESDLQIAEALINLPSTALKIKIANELHEQPFTQTSQTIVENTAKVCSTLDSAFPMETDTLEIAFSTPKQLEITTSDADDASRFETDQEKSENLNAAQSLVQMSETLEHKLQNAESEIVISENAVVETIKPRPHRPNNGVDNNTVEQEIALMSEENKSESTNKKAAKYETTSSKLLKILEEPNAFKVSPQKVTPVKQVVKVVQNKEKILNFDVGKASPVKAKAPTPAPKQKIIIRRTNPGTNLINNLNEPMRQEKLILSTKPIQDGGSVQTYTIQASPNKQTDPSKIIIQPKVRKITNVPQKLQKIKPQSLVSISNETNPPAKVSVPVPTTNEDIFDINSMPIVLSDEILTPENIDKMPIVMSDGNLITNPVTTKMLQIPPMSPITVSSSPKVVKQIKQTIEPESIKVVATPSKPELKTLLMNPVPEGNKVSTPNILSKSSKLRGTKPMLVIDKATGKQKIIMTKAEPVPKEINRPPPTKVQSIGTVSGKNEKFIILPTSSPRQNRTQKIVIDPQTGKAHVLVAKSSDNMPAAGESKPVSAKLIPSASAGATGTVMIITNAQGTQSRIMLTPEHEKLLFPNKQHKNLTQLKAAPAQRIIANATNVSHKQQTIVSAGAGGGVGGRGQARLVPKQKGAIITSKGQLIVGGRLATPTQNIAPMPEIRPAIAKRPFAPEPKKIIQTVQKTHKEPLLFLTQNPGTVLQLTAAQFEHLQRTGQLVQKPPTPMQHPPQENKIIVQKSVTITSNEAVLPVIQKQQRVRAARHAAPAPPAKKPKQEIVIKSVSAPPVPALIQTSRPVETIRTPAVANTVSITTSSSAYPELDNFEEMLPSTAIIRQSEPVSVPTIEPEVPCPPLIESEPVAPPPPPAPAPAAPAPEPEPAPAVLADGSHLIAMAGEHFGGVPGSFYLCVEDNGTLTPIDNRPLVLENNQLVPMQLEPAAPERRDILEAALANSDVFHAEPHLHDAPDFRDLNANVSVHCRVSETSTVLNQPIMTPVEVPSKGDCEPSVVTSNLEDGLAVIGVTPHTIPTSLELPITVTNPRIAARTSDPLTNTTYSTHLLTSTGELSYETHAAPISMPLLTEEEDVVGKSMPILTDEAIERTVSSVESAVDSPGSLEEAGGGGGGGGAAWSRRLLTPGSDTSDTSVEIPYQPQMQLSVNDLSRTS